MTAQLDNPNTEAQPAHHRFHLNPFLRQFSWHAKQTEQRLRKSLEDCNAPKYRTAVADLEAALQLRNALRQAAHNRRAASGHTGIHPASTRKAAANLIAIGEAASRLSPDAVRLCLNPPVTSDQLRALSGLKDPARQIDPAVHRGDRATDLYRGAEHTINLSLDTLEKPGTLEPLEKHAARERMRHTVSQHLDRAPRLQRERFAAALSKAASPPSHGNELEGALQFLGILMSAGEGPFQTARALTVAGSHPFRAFAWNLVRHRTRRLAGALTAPSSPWIARLTIFAANPQPPEDQDAKLRSALASEADASADLSPHQLHRATMTLRASRQFALALIDAPEHIPSSLPGFRRSWIKPNAPQRQIHQLLYGRPPQPGSRIATHSGDGTLTAEADSAVSAAIRLDPDTAARWTEWEINNEPDRLLANPEWILQSIHSLPTPQRDRILEKHAGSDPKASALQAANDPDLRPRLLEYHQHQRSAAKLDHATTAIRATSRISTIHTRLTAASRNLHRIPTRDLTPIRNAPTGSPQAENSAVMRDIHIFGSTPADPANLQQHLVNRWSELDESRKRTYIGLALADGAHPDLPLQPPDEHEEFQLDLTRPEHRRWLHALSAYLSDAADHIRNRPSTPLDHLETLHATRIAPYSQAQRRVPDEKSAETARSKAARGI